VAATPAPETSASKSTIMAILNAMISRLPGAVEYRRSWGMGA
jgi:hypothetical protein